MHCRMRRHHSISPTRRCFDSASKEPESIGSNLAFSPSTAALQSNIGINSAMTQDALFAGSTLLTSKTGTPSWRPMIAVFNGATSVIISLDGVSVSGTAGASVGTGIRFGRTAGSSGVYSIVDIDRAAMIPHAADVTERAAICVAVEAQLPGPSVPLVHHPNCS
jgi:hypothetical protein